MAPPFEIDRTLDDALNDIACEQPTALLGALRGGVRVREDVVLQVRQPDGQNVTRYPAGSCRTEQTNQCGVVRNVWNVAAPPILRCYTVVLYEIIPQHLPVVVRITDTHVAQGLQDVIQLLHEKCDVVVLHLAEMSPHLGESEKENMREKKPKSPCLHLVLNLL